MTAVARAKLYAGESKITRNSLFFKRSAESPQEESVSKNPVDVTVNDSSRDNSNPTETPQDTPATTPVRNKPDSPVRKPQHIAVTPSARPQRNRTAPRKYQDYIRS